MKSHTAFLEVVGKLKIRLFSFFRPISNQTHRFVWALSLQCLASEVLHMRKSRNPLSALCIRLIEKNWKSDQAFNILYLKQLNAILEVFICDEYVSFRCEISIWGLPLLKVHTIFQQGESRVLLSANGCFSIVFRSKGQTRRSGLNNWPFRKRLYAAQIRSNGASRKSRPSVINFGAKPPYLNLY